MAQRILLVDDDAGVREAFARVLEEEGFEVETASDGEKALMLFERLEFDLLIIDALLPVIDGFKLIGKIRKKKQGRSIPIIVITGVYRSPAQAKWATNEFDLTSYLVKPVSNDELLASVRKALKLESSTGAARKETGPGKFYLLDPFKVPPKGSLKQCPLPVIVYRLFRAKATGGLMIKRGTEQKIFMFDKGQIVSARSNILEECLGQTLVKRGIITEDQNRISLEISRKTGVKQGEVLAAQGWIERHALPRYLKEHLEDRVLSTFAWLEGEYAFRPVQQLPPLNVTLNRNTPTLVKEGIAEYVPSDWIQTEVIDHYSEYAVCRSQLAKTLLQLVFHNRRELKFLDALVNAVPLRDAVRLSPFDKEYTIKLLYTWLVLGILAMRHEAEVKRVAAGQQPTQQDSSQQTQQSDQAAAVVSEAKPVEVRHDEATLAQLTPDQRKFYDQLKNFYDSIRNKTYFEILDVDRNVDLTQLKKNYFAYAKKLHPDALPHREVAVIRDLADKIFSLISTAYDTLSKPSLREEYVKKLEGKSDDATDIAFKVMAAEQKFIEAQAHMRKKNWQKALELIEESINLHPDEGEYHAYRAWAKLNLAGGAQNRPALLTAKKELEQAEQQAPRSAQTKFFLGMVYSLLGDTSSAMRKFEEALEINPHHDQASVQLKYLQRKQEEAKKKGGLFSGLFGKKKT